MSFASPLTSLYVCLGCSGFVFQLSLRRSQFICFGQHIVLAESFSCTFLLNIMTKNKKDKLFLHCFFNHKTLEYQYRTQIHIIEDVSHWECWVCCCRWSVLCDKVLFLSTGLIWSFWSHVAQWVTPCCQQSSDWLPASACYLSVLYFLFLVGHTVSHWLGQNVFYWI